MINIRLPLLVATLLALLSTAACQPNPETPVAATSPAQDMAATPDWDGFVNNYIEAHFVAHPAQAVMMGRHEFDGQLPDWSRAGIEREIARLKQARADAVAFPADSLSPEQQFQNEQRQHLSARHPNRPHHHCWYQ